jgi:hypothetical protein
MMSQKKGQMTMEAKGSSKKAMDTVMSVGHHGRYGPNEPRLRKKKKEWATPKHLKGEYVENITKRPVWISVTSKQVAN